MQLHVPMGTEPSKTKTQWPFESITVTSSLTLSESNSLPSRLAASRG